MPEILTKRHISARIEDLIKKSNNKLVLISPYLRIPQDIIELLKLASYRGVFTTIIYGKEELKSEEWEKLKDIYRLRVLFSKNLHAKCYYNDTHAIITSMNLYDFSEINNIELGVEINYKDDGEAFSRLNYETKIITSTAEQKNGFCIRCGKWIQYDQQHPLCERCYHSWSVFANYNYPEHHCHKCGDLFFNFISMKKPLCYKCQHKD